MESIIIIVVLIIIIAILFFKMVRIVPESETWVIERLGRYHTCYTSGINFMIPIIEHVSKKVTKKELLLDIPPQPVITKDTVSITADSIIYFNIIDARAFAYEVQDAGTAIQNLAYSTLRNVIGTMELEECLQSRDAISRRMTIDIDKATDKWGIKVNRVEIKTFQPPRETLDSMERQMKAERERREQLVLAEGEKQAAILNAEKEKEVQLLNAQAARDAAELNAEAHRIATVQQAEAEKEALLIRAEAEKQAALKRAEAQAEAIRITQAATADGLRAINAAAPGEAALRLKAYEAFAQAADGKATKIIVPSDMQGAVGLASAVKDILH